ncbi:MAG: hypothetical protein QXH07_04210 [Thermoplasmata archaeon]
MYFIYAGLIMSQGGRTYSEVSALKKLEEEIIEEEEKKGLKGTDLERVVVAKMMQFVAPFTAKKYFYEIRSKKFEETENTDEEIKKKLNEIEQERDRLARRLKEIKEELSK